jgi:hypothetical protein
MEDSDDPDKWDIDWPGCTDKERKKRERTMNLMIGKT